LTLILSVLHDSFVVLTTANVAFRIRLGLLRWQFQNL